MKRYNLFQALIMSFYSQALYRDVAKNWRGVGLLYLLILLAICWVPATYQLKQRLAYFVAVEAPPVIAEIPTININTKGEASIKENVPYFIKYPNSERVLGIIDTSGQFVSLKNTEAKVLLTKTHLLIANGPHDELGYSLTNFPNFTFTQANFTHFIEFLSHWMVILLFPIALFISWVYRFVQVAIYALIGSLFSSVLKCNLRYIAILRLATVALTPVIVVASIFSFYDITFAAELPAFFFFAMVYLFFAVKANQTKED